MDVMAGFKQTEVGVIPDDWKVVKLGDHAAFRTGPFGSALHKSDYVYGGVPIINPMQIVDGKLVPTPRMTISEAAARRLSEFRLRAGEVVIGRRGEMGRCAVVEPGSDGWLCGTGSMIVRPKESLDERFAQRLLSDSRTVAAIEAASVGSTMINLNQGTLSNLLIPLPSLRAEQANISQALSDADALIESLEQLLAKKRQIKQGAMQELLSGKRRAPGFSGKWELKPLGSLLTIRHGKSQHAVETSDGQYPVLATGGEIGRANAYLCDKPSVLIGRKGTIDRPQYMDTPFWSVDTLFYSDVHSNFSAKFLFYRFCLIDWKRYNEASGVPSLNARTIEQIEIEVPEHSEQIAIASILSDMGTELAALETRLAKARHLQQGMTQALLSGRIRLV